MSFELWQSRIRITQVPANLKKDYVMDPQVKKEIEYEKLWLCNPFLDNTIYGAEFTIDSDFSWVFFMKAQSEHEALRLGHSFLIYLKGKFPGLDGNVRAIPILPHILNNEVKLYEIVLPRPYLNYHARINLIKKFINLFHFKNIKKTVKLFLLWQMDDSIGKLDGMSLVSDRRHLLDSFKIKIYVHADINEEPFVDLEPSDLELKSQLEYLTSDIQNGSGNGAYLIKTDSDAWKNILKSNIFWENIERRFTGTYYEKIYREIDDKILPGFVNPYVTDFTIPRAMPLPKVILIENENVNYMPISIENKYYICIGKISHDGVSTDLNAYIPLDNFSQSILIGGMPGSGKTRLISQIMDEIYNKAPNIGILTLNLGKGNQEAFYRSDKVIKFGDPDFRIPYFVEGEYLEKCLQETASYLIAALGLKNVVENNMLNVMKSFYYNNIELPKSLRVLFNNLLLYFDKKRYHEKFQTNIKRAIENRVLSLLSDPVIDKTLELLQGFQIPSWFQDWMGGKKIFLDFSMCNKYTKRLLTSAIFQLIRTLTPDSEALRLKNIIVVDEAHQLLEKSITHNPDDDDFISKSQLEKIFTGLLREFRSKGLSFILSDQTPSRLFDCVATIPSIKILFRLGHPCNTLFTSNQQEIEYLNLQKNRRALIYNGVTGEKFVIETLDLEMPKKYYLKQNIKKKVMLNNRIWK